MMKRLLSGLLLLSGVLGAAFDPGTWAFRREVKTIPGSFDLLDMDASVFRTSRAQLNDLRLLRAGTQVPYVLRVSSGGREEENFRPTVTDRIAIPGLGTQAVLDMNGHGPHNLVEIETDKTNFRQRVRIEASNDRRQWGVIRSDGTIFDISTRDQHARNVSVPYPESTARYLRLTVEGWNDPSALQSIAMRFVSLVPAQREVISDQAGTGTLEKASRSTLFDVDFGFDRPFDRIWFEVGPGLFSRQVTVSVSRDKKNWTVSGFGYIERTEDRERLSVTLSETWTRYVRLAISNEDNAPLTVRRVRLEAAKRQLIFPADEPGPYWLYSGNAKAEAVRYDLRAVLPSDLKPLEATFGKVEDNPAYRAPEPPLTERWPWVLPTVLILLVPALGFLAFRMLRQVNTVP